MPENSGQHPNSIIIASGMGYAMQKRQSLMANARRARRNPQSKTHR
jgi:hypothetical protein